MDRSAILILLAFGIASVSGASYLISAPSTIIRGSTYGASVDILNTTNVDVTMELMSRVYDGRSHSYKYNVKKSVNNIFSQGQTGVLSFPIESDFSCQSCYLHIRGRGNLQFERQLYVSVVSKAASVLVQTDKAIYKPGQRVRFRVLAVYSDLKLYKGTFQIEIKDPNRNSIKYISGVQTTAGVYEGHIDLSDQLQFGDWMINARTEGVYTDSKLQYFTVEDYDLPRFEVKVDLPPYKLTMDNTLSGTIKAKYTFGQPVKGMVELHVGPDQGSDSCGHFPRSVTSVFKIDGEADFNVPTSDIRRVVSLYDRSRVRVTAIVKEDTTGVRLNGSSVVTFYRNEYQVKFLDNTPGVFKPGLPYTAYVQVYTPDDEPPKANQKDHVFIHSYASYRVTVKDQSLYSTSSFTGSYPLPGYDVALPVDGVLPVKLDIPHNATSITINIHYKGMVARKTVSKSFSPSDNFLQMTIENKDLKAGDTAHGTLMATEPLEFVTVMILSRGQVLSTLNLDGHGNKTMAFALPLTAKMAPTAHVLAYYKRTSTEIVADSIAFNIDGIFNNKVSVDFNVDKSEPNQEVDLTVTADPNSMVNVLAVDQSVLLLKSGNDITVDKVEEELSSYDTSKKPTNSKYALTYSAQSADDVFTQTGLRIVTDVPFPSPPGFNNNNYPSFGGSAAGFYPTIAPGMTYAPSAGVFSTPLPMPAVPDTASASSPLKQVEHIRNIFPEAWLWQSQNVSSNGVASIKTTVPDTITSWVTSAFATNDLSGLGVAPTTAKLNVFRPFFVSLTYPSSITRKEQAVVQATVFNYLPSSAKVLVTLKPSSYYQSVLMTANGTETLSSDIQQQTVQVDSGKQGVVYFPMIGTSIGVANMEITAQTSTASDGVRRQMVVKAEGAPVSFNYPIYVNLDSKTQAYSDKLSFPVPPSIITDSQKMRVKVTGDLLGPSLSNLGSLLALPTGCGEQSMVKFAPDLYIAQYLKSTNQMSNYWDERIRMLLNAGYQRELSYQRYDGGFSAFGNSDEAGSTWLTAFVARAMSEAREFIYVDPQLLKRSLDWILDRQNKDGSFSEFGRVLDQNTQGSHTGPALTAYVLLAILQNRDVYPIDACEKAHLNCYQAYKVGNATLKAMTNLETAIDSNSITDDFSLAIVTYALGLANSAKSDMVFNTLLSRAKTAGGLQYWNADAKLPTKTNRVVPYGSTYTSWKPPSPQARPIDILTTAYGVLSFATRNKLDEGLPALRWLIKQRSTSGGFVSSQDTTVAMNAIAAYARKSIRPSTNLRVQVAGDSKETLNFNLTLANALELQTKEYQSAPSILDLDVTGSGMGIIEIEHNFHVNDELSTPSFDVSTVLLDDDIDSFNLMICTKWLWNRKTGMVVQEIGIPSGFNPDMTTLGNVVGMKRTERRGDTVALYFDEISQTSTCYSLLMTRTNKVAKSEKSFIRTFDYYEPADQSTVFYQPRKLRDSTICDVCDGCCP